MLTYENLTIAQRQATYRDLMQRDYTARLYHWDAACWLVARLDPTAPRRRTYVIVQWSDNPDFEGAREMEPLFHAHGASELAERMTELEGGENAYWELR